MNILRNHGRALALFLALGPLLAVVLSVIIAEKWGLNACYLCMFQRLLFLCATITMLFVWWRWHGGLSATAPLVLTIAISLGGVGVAGYQSWLQWFPQMQLSCGAGTQNLIERIVEWLGQLWPSMFMATGFCEDDNFKILYLSFANWSMLFFLGLSLGSLALLHTRLKKLPPA